MAVGNGNDSLPPSKEGRFMSAQKAGPKPIATFALLVALVTALIASAVPAAAGAAPPGCKNRTNTTYQTLLECVTLEGVRAHQAAFQAIADANDDRVLSGNPRRRAPRATPRAWSTSPACSRTPATRDARSVRVHVRLPGRHQHTASRRRTRAGVHGRKRASARRRPLSRQSTSTSFRPVRTRVAVEAPRDFAGFPPGTSR